MKRVFGFILFLFLSANVLAQNHGSIRALDSTYFSARLDSLSLLFQCSGEIPKQLRLPALIALSYYPELRGATIVFKEKRIHTTLNTRPSVFSLLFRGRLKRTYVIRINSEIRGDRIRLAEVPFNATVGLFGHEFGHVLDYRDKGILQVLNRGLAYTNRKGKRKFEKEIDLITIGRGLGWQLYDWTFYVLNQSKASETYKAYKGDVYLKPTDIEHLIGASDHEK